jgi:hypothetical protein
MPTYPLLPMLAALLLSGCAANLHYTPQWPLAAPAAKFARIEVVNARPPNKGGDDPRAVGIARGGYGNPVTFRQDDPKDLERLIREATRDALHGAGLDEQPEAGNRLVARVLHFWMDGYVGYAASIEIEYSLLDASGTAIWSEKMTGHEAGAVLSYGAASDLLSRALADLASNATAKFRESTFQRALQ